MSTPKNTKALASAETVLYGTWSGQNIHTATAATGAASAPTGGILRKITSEALTTAAGAVYTLTYTNAWIQADSMVIASVGLGTATTGTPTVTTSTPAAGSVVIKVQNIHASAAVNGTLVIWVLVFNPA